MTPNTPTSTNRIHPPTHQSTIAYNMPIICHRSNRLGAQIGAQSVKLTLPALMALWSGSSTLARCCTTTAKSSTTSRNGCSHQHTATQSGSVADPQSSSVADPQSSSVAACGSMCECGTVGCFGWAVTSNKVLAIKAL